MHFTHRIRLIDVSSMPTKEFKYHNGIFGKLKWILIFLSFYSIQAGEVVQNKASSKSYADQGIIEISGSASGSYRFDGRGGSAVLSPVISYFVMQNWFFGAGLSLQYSNFDPDPKNVAPNSKIQWQLSYLPTVEFGYAKSFSASWYWALAAGYGYYDAISYQNNGPHFYNLMYVNASVKHAIGDSSLLIIGTRFDTQSIGHLFVGFSVYF